VEKIIGDLDELTTAVWHLAHADAEEIRQNAAREAEEIRAKARGRADRKRAEILRDARAETKKIRRQRKVRSTRQEREQFLQARQALLQEVWQAAEERLREMTANDTEYSAALERMTASAVRVLGGGAYLLASDDHGHKLLTSKRLEKWSRSLSETLGAEVDLQRADEPADTWGGLVVSDAGNGRRVDMTFAARLRLASEEIRGDVFRKLVQS